jgi:hypothetical protein
MNTTLQGNVQLAKLSQIGKGIKIKTKRIKTKKRSKRYRKRKTCRQRGGQAVAPLPYSELNNVNDTHAAITQVAGQSNANSQYDKVALKTPN